MVGVERRAGGSMLEDIKVRFFCSAAMIDRDDDGRAQDRLASGAGVSEEVLANPFYPRNVVVHPLVLLSTVDHFLRVNPKGGKGRVVGVLLGEVYQGRVDVTNSFAGARPATTRALSELV